MEKLKQCTGKWGCGRWLPLSAFSRKPGPGDGRDHRCKKCYRTKYKPEWDQKQREKRARARGGWQPYDWQSPMEKEIGSLHPKSRRSKTGRLLHDRSPKVRAAVMARAQGKCEGCGLQITWVNKRGIPCMHGHHMIDLTKGGPDKEWSMAALCGTCHDRVHNSTDKIQFLESIYQRNLSFLRKVA